MASKNYILNSDFTRGLNSWGVWASGSAVVIDDAEVTGFTKAIQITVTQQNSGYIQLVGMLPAGTYTYSGWVKSSIAGKDYLQVSALDSVTGLSSYPKTGNTTTAMTRMAITFTLTNPSTVYVQLGRGGGDATTTTTFTGTGFQLEAGGAATAWQAGTEPNLMQNTGFLNGLTNWNTNIGTGSTMTGSIIDDDASPTNKALHINATASGDGYWQPYTTVTGLTIGHTYTLSLMTKGAASGIHWGWEGLVQTTSLTDQYQHIAYTFTYSTAHNFVFYTNAPGDLYVQSIKLEEGSYATDWVASRADINSGFDRSVIAKAQYTIVDWNDKVGLVASIGSNQPMTQQYTPATETFIPDWTKTNLVLTASLFKNGGADANIINDGHVKTIKWYKMSVLDGTTPVLIANDANYTVNGNTLTVVQNVLTTLDSIDFICEITYTDPVSGSDLLAKANTMFSRVQNAGPLTFAVASLPNGNSVQGSQANAYKANDNRVGRNIERYTDYLSGSATGWSQAGTGLTMTYSIIPEPNAPTGQALQATYTTINNGGTTTSGGPHKPPISRLTVGVTYSWSVWVRASRAMSLQVGHEQGGQLTVNLTTSWQKFNLTFVATNTTYNSFTFYQPTAPTQGDILYIHSLKLEEGPAPTEWTMAPEDYPSMDEALGKNTWVLKKRLDTRGGAYAPIYDDIRGKNTSIYRNIADSATVIQETLQTPTTPYVSHAQTSIYTPNDVVVPMSLQSNDMVTAYVNNAVAYQDAPAVFNYYRQSGFRSGGLTATYDATSQTYTAVIPANSTYQYVKGIAYNLKNAILKPGKTYTISYQFYSDTSGVPVSIDTNNTGVDNASTGTNDNDVGASRHYVTPASVAGQWVTVTATMTMGTNMTQNFYDCSTLGVTGSYSAATDVTVKWRNIQFEEGATASAFVHNPGDSARNFSLNLKKGWNTVDLLWNEFPSEQNGVWSLSAGGVNLQKNSALVIPRSNNGGPTYYPILYSTMTDTDGSQFYRVKRTNTAYNPTTLSLYNNIDVSMMPHLSDMVGKPVTISMKARASTPINMTMMSYQYGATTTHFSLDNTTVALGTDWTTIVQTIPSFPSIDSTGGIRFTPYAFTIPSGTIDTFFVDIKQWKIEYGNNATNWTPAPEDVANSTPNLVSTGVGTMNASYSTAFDTSLSNLIAKCSLYRGSIIDTTNVAYQWYKQDSTVTTDQGGGIGWLKLTGTGVETGYTSDTLTIPPAAVTSIAYYKCIMRDTQVDSITYNGYFNAIVAVSNVYMPISVEVVTNGTILLQGQGSKTLTAKLTQMGREIDAAGTQYTYKWYRYLQDGTKDATWNSNQGFKTGKSIIITDPDVALKATFSVEVN